ncbi:heme biosynthesis HemY N-terminal domain-containing protein [Thiohalobacter sp. IOR34]|uniref:heme biosynthesis HemY N-terminal domain-containing protein n=1 Tax=Thiohalobacter sp. IOR34 TaxID=3057176 RepID=UPI0025B192EC|nr:heme biosynthesis HemY N-terminal domain-containing protein [Thiohalobacter sp. IOR34]WJW75596.1 heme biosynthesis HemY N-terminal domain-containing protein [Thiohalobacter sp. IOR34]
MRFLIAALLALLVATGLGLLLMKDPGYVLIGYGPWTVETSLSLLLTVVLLLFAVFYLLLRLLAGMRRAPRQLRSWDRRRRALRARNELNRGLIELAEGNWSAAERRLIRHAADSDNPLLNYLAAARAAQQQGAHERRDHYLRLAHQAMPDADVAVGLTQAELQIAHRQMEQALATLSHLRQVAPRHAYVLKMLVELYQRLGDWEHLRDLLPELRRRHVLPAEAVDALEVKLHGELLEAAARSGDAEALRETWGRVPRRLRETPELVLHYARQLQVLGEDGEAEQLLRAALRRQWNEQMVDLYGRLAGEHRGLQLQTAEEWLQGHDKDPVLLLALGRIALRNELWGKARGYLEAALALQPSVEGYQLLGRLLERMHEPEAAVACFRHGLALAAGEDGALLPAPGAGTAVSDEAASESADKALPAG